MQKQVDSNILNSHFDSNLKAEKLLRYSDVQMANFTLLFINKCFYTSIKIIKAINV